MIIRKMESRDVKAVAKIESTVADGWSEKGIEAALCSPAARCFVAQNDDENGEAVAFCCFTLVLDEANLDALSVAESARRKGYAHALLRYAFKSLYAEGARDIFLEVRAQNAPAIALYDKLGFVKTGMRRGFYKEPADDATIMTKMLEVSE